MCAHNSGRQKLIRVCHFTVQRLSIWKVRSFRLSLKEPKQKKLKVPDPVNTARGSRNIHLTDLVCEYEPCRRGINAAALG
jgi:hypothetical protein